MTKKVAERSCGREGGEGGCSEPGSGAHIGEWEGRCVDGLILSAVISLERGTGGMTRMREKKMSFQDLGCRLSSQLIWVVSSGFVILRCVWFVYLAPLQCCISPFPAPIVPSVGQRPCPDPPWPEG